MNAVAKIIRRFGIFIAVIAFALFVTTLILVGSANQTFSDSMLNGQENGLFGNGSLFILYDMDARVYSTQYISSEYAASKPEDVRYVISISRVADHTADYSSGVKGFKRWVRLSIDDYRINTTVIDRTIWGDNLPHTINRNVLDHSDYYASAPSDNDIKNEIQRLIKSIQ